MTSTSTSDFHADLGSSFVSLAVNEPKKEEDVYPLWWTGLIPFFSALFFPLIVKRLKRDSSYQDGYIMGGVMACISLLILIGGGYLMGFFQ